MTTYKIGDFSKLCRVPVSALRYYAEIGLLEPAHVDEFTGYRYYGADQLTRLNRILALRDLGFSLEQIRQLLAEDLSAEKLRGMFVMKQVEIAQRVEEEQTRLRQVASRIDQIATEGKMAEQDVILKQVNPMRVMSIREVVSTAQDVGVLLGRSAEALISHGVQPVAPPFTIFHDPEFSDADLDVEIVFPTAAGAPMQIPVGDGSTLISRDLPGMDEAATIIHTGDYDTLEVSYLILGHWIEENAYQLTGPAREIYLRPHMDGEVGITEVQFPVQKA